ncbi:MAG: peptidoglycan-associated lipoprotein Pal [Planctomycetes bacterium]|nr:peptidoglycan-associated lipoprotein Pal [Planctomycetota bacterium]
MLGRRIVRLSAVVWLLVWVGADGCAKRSGMVEVGAGVGPSASSTPGGDSATSLERGAATEFEGTRDTDTVVVGLSDVFFEFNSAIISPDARPSLDQTAQWLRTSTSRRVVIEGHADERGTNEYNMALGERRAQALKRYLVASGIEDRRIKIVSYGEEKPFCRGGQERCWEENRRGHFVQAD